METIYQDVKYGVRMLARSPGFTAVAVLSLAIGIGANTAVFTFVDALLLRPLPGRNPEELVSIYTSDFSGPLHGASSYPDYLDFRDRSDAFSGLSAFLLAPVVVTGEEGSDPAVGGYATGEFFSVLGLSSAYGRFFAPGEDAPGAEPVAVLSHALWEGRLGAAPAIVGDRIQVNGRSVTVVGIAAEGFHGVLRGAVVDLWLPMRVSPALRGPIETFSQRDDRGLFVLGRLREGVSPEQAQASLAGVARALHEEHPGAWTNVRGEPRAVTVLPESDSRIAPQIRGALVSFVGLFAVVVGLVLMLACTNTANLLLARAAARRKEIATRLSLGASRGRLVRQLLTESVILAALAGAAGVLLALWTVRIVAAWQTEIPVGVDLGLALDGTVLFFALGLSLATGVLFGLVPALRASRGSLAGAVRDETGSAFGGRRHALRAGLIVGQVAISVVLLVASGLFLRSLVNADAIDPGFDPNGVLLASVDLGLAGYTDEEGLAFFDALAVRLEGHPGVEATSVARNLPLGLGFGRRGIEVEDYAEAEGEDMEVHYDVVGPDFFEVLHIPIVRGRAFTPGDAAGAPRVVVVNEAFVRRYWPGRDPPGKHVTRGGNAMEVIGVARDGKYRTLGEDPLPYVYYPHRQDSTSRVSILVRTREAPESFAGVLRSEVAALDPELPVYGVQTMSDHLGVALLPVRVASSVLGVFGVVALVLATGGIYGVMAFVVGRRRHEFGVRVSLGAAPGTIAALVVRQGMLWVLAGSAIGLAAAIGLTRFLTFLLYGVSPSDPLTFAGIFVLMSSAALLACYVPARRAARVDPLEALRSL